MTMYLEVTVEVANSCAEHHLCGVGCLPRQRPMLGRSNDTPQSMTLTLTRTVVAAPDNYMVNAQPGLHSNLFLDGP